MLRNHDVAIGAFFTSFAATTLLTRFGLLRWLQRLPQLVLAEAALIVIAMEFLLLAMIVTPIVAICAGVLFGLGYAVIFPTVTNWAAALYPGRERSRPIALTTSGFHAGALAAPLLTGFALAHTGYPPVLAMLAAVTLAVGSVIAVHERGAGDAPLAATSYDTEHERIEIAPADDQLAAFFRRERHHRPPR